MTKREAEPVFCKEKECRFFSGDRCVYVLDPLGEGKMLRASFMDGSRLLATKECKQRKRRMKTVGKRVKKM